MCPFGNLYIRLQEKNLNLNQESNLGGEFERGLTAESG